MSFRGFTAPAAIAVACALFLSASAAAAPHKKGHLSASCVGAQISGTQAVYSCNSGSFFGRGAGVETVTVSGGVVHDTAVTYYGVGSATARDTFTIGPADASGVSPISGSGGDVKGTGKFKGLRSSDKLTGEFNTKNGTFTVTFTGTYSL